MNDRNLFTDYRNRRRSRRSVSNPTIDERFAEFDRENPHVYRLFVTFAVQARNAGHDRYSSDAILHRIRWHLTVETTRDGGFALNNDFTSRYARKLIEEKPEFRGFFELRRLHE